MRSQSTTRGAEREEVAVPPSAAPLGGSPSQPARLYAALKPALLTSQTPSGHRTRPQARTARLGGRFHCSWCRREPALWCGAGMTPQSAFSTAPS